MVSKGQAQEGVVYLGHQRNQPDGSGRWKASLEKQGDASSSLQIAQ